MNITLCLGRFLLVASPVVFALGCGASGPEGTATGQQPITSLPGDSGTAQQPDAKDTDAGKPVACAGLTEATCEATAGCAAGYVGLCDCSCPGPAAPAGAGVSSYEARECAGCSASCHTFAACVPVPATSPVCSKDYECNEDPTISAIRGTCEKGACVCDPGFPLQPSGKCR
jgi:hypothetical protein